MSKFIDRSINLISCILPLKSWRNDFRNYVKSFFYPTILTRTACLGNFAFEYIDFKNYKLHNHQKNRIDYALLINEDKKRKINLKEVLKYTPKESLHLTGIYKCEEKDIFKYNNVKALIMDSFSELTDKMFISKNKKSSFCTHFRDIIHSEQFQYLYECTGSIEDENLEKKYNIFFDKINKKYGTIPIIFINFPTKFETREEYLKRSEKIKDAISAISARGGVIQILPRLVERHETDTAIYHFSKKTYFELAKDIVKILKENNINVDLKERNTYDK